MLAASLNAFFSLLRFEGPSAAAAAAPRRERDAPSPSAPVGRSHLSQRERQEALPLRPWHPFKREARSAPVMPLAPPFGGADAKRLRGFISSLARCSRREPAPADAVCHCGPSREKAKEKSPQAFLLCKSKIIFPLSLSERSGDNSNRPFTPVLPLRSCRTPGTAQSPPRTAPPACQCPHWRCRSAGCPR